MTSPSPVIERLRRLTPAEIGLILSAWLRFAWVDLVIRTRPFPRWRAWLDGPPALSVARGRSLRAARVIALTEWVARHHWAPMNCLRRCIVQRNLLARHGIDAQLHLGVRADGRGGVEAHAWLSHAGRLLNDSADVVDSYKVLQADAFDDLPRVG